MAVTELQRQYLDAMGVQLWSLRDEVSVSTDMDAEPVAELVQPESSAVVSANRKIVVVEDWQRLEYEVAHCTACDLHQQRNQAVFGVGDHQADWMLIGEAPGADEDRQGEPFMGHAGELLNEMLLAIGLQRQQVFIANVIKCRPPNNRKPRSDEVRQCQDYLQRQIALVQPQVILALGGVAAQHLLKTQDTVGRLRCKEQYYGDDAIPVVVTYHPTYLLRSPNEKRKAWQDLQRAHQIVVASNVVTSVE